MKYFQPSQQKEVSFFYNNISYFIIFIYHLQRKMQPSMRYHCAKLSQLVHEKKNYQLHVSSVDKIMNKSYNEYQRRSQQLQQLKNRKFQSYNYSQYKRSKQIGHINQLLFTKIYQSSKIDKNLSPNPCESFDALEKKIIERSQQKIEDNLKHILNNHFVLKNHRQSPINKSTLLQRTRQNLRLAKKIVNPVVTYKTSEFQKLHQQASHVKYRIMKYDREQLKNKSQLYVEKKLSLNNFHRRGSNSSLGSPELFKQVDQKDNPQNNIKITPKTRFSSFLMSKSKN